MFLICSINCRARRSAWIALGERGQFSCWRLLAWVGSDRGELAYLITQQAQSRRMRNYWEINYVQLQCLTKDEFVSPWLRAARSNGLMRRGIPSPGAQRSVLVVTTVTLPDFQNGFAGCRVIHSRPALILRFGPNGCRNHSAGSGLVWSSLIRWATSSISGFRGLISKLFLKRWKRPIGIFTKC